MDCEEIHPYDDTRCKSAQVREMFDNIAPAYDFMNRAMTFGIDKLWRRRAVRILEQHGASRILDVATGTGDLALLMGHRLKPESINGIDLSEKMIEVGRQKIKEAGLDHMIQLSVADCLNLPYADGSFDAVTVAYGVRNFENLLRGYSEMHRVLQPGGMLTVIELSTPRSKLVRPLYNLYSRHVIPAVGRLVSKDTRAYSYLPESIAAVPQGDDMLRLMRQAGFAETHCRRLTFGTCSIYTAVRR